MHRDGLPLSARTMLRHIGWHSSRNETCATSRDKRALVFWHWRAGEHSSAGWILPPGRRIRAMFGQVRASGEHPATAGRFRPPVGPRSSARTWQPLAQCRAMRCRTPAPTSAKVVCVSGVGQPVGRVRLIVGQLRRDFGHILYGIRQIVFGRAWATLATARCFRQMCGCGDVTLSERQGCGPDLGNIEPKSADVTSSNFEPKLSMFLATQVDIGPA